MRHIDLNIYKQKSAAQNVYLNILCQQYVLSIQTASNTAGKWFRSVVVQKALVERSHYVAILQGKWQNKLQSVQLSETRSSATTERPRDMMCQSKSAA